MKSTTARLAAWGLWFVSLCSALLSLICAIVAMRLSQYSFNDEGHHFSSVEGVVYHQQSLIVFSMIAVVAGVCAGAAGVIAHRISKRS